MACVQEFSESELKKIKSEFTRLGNKTYLDHVGTTLYGESQIREICESLQNNLYCNPHTSPLTQNTIDHVRERILQHFNADPREYSVIFTSNATGALKLLGESFSFTNRIECGTFYYLRSNHTSVLGMRSICDTQHTKALSNDEIYTQLHTTPISSESHERNSLVAFSAQCNFNGYKFPLDVIEKIHKYGLSADSNYYVCLDAASFVSTNFLDLGKYHPDYVCMSFYKTFGYPTGLGALIVSKRGEQVLRNKKYYGGGTVQVVLPSEKNFHIMRKHIVGQFEDGTTPFLSIVALSKSFEYMEKLIPLNSEKNFMVRISRHVFNLAKYTYETMKKLRHYNGNPVVKFYHITDFSDISTQGGVVNFNIMRSDGRFVGFSEVGNLALLNNITLRTGCLCNAGACQTNCDISEDEMLSFFKRDRVCGSDMLDIADGKPTGSIRVAFGYMSTKEDADSLISFIRKFYIDNQISKDNVMEVNKSNFLSSAMRAIHIDA